MSQNFLHRTDAVIGMVDAQFEDQDDATCELILQAVIRKLIQSRGAHEAAVLIQQYADQCAVFEMKPIEYWRGSPPPISRK